MKPMMFFRLTKVDEEKREVWGRATQEVVDKANEIFDYASSKPFFERWSEGFAKDTDGRSLGNIRSMHSKVAAGKVIHIDFNDAEKAIDIGTKIIDNNEWEKVMEGVHTGFSIGGSYEKRWTDTASGATRFTAKPAEISLVDSPCVPTAKFFDVVKADGTTVQKAFKSEALARVEKFAGEEIIDTMTAVEALQSIFWLYLDESREPGEPADQLPALRAVIENLKTFIASEIKEDNSQPRSQAVMALAEAVKGLEKGVEERRAAVGGAPAAKTVPQELPPAADNHKEAAMTAEELAKAAMALEDVHKCLKGAMDDHKEACTKSASAHDEFHKKVQKTLRGIKGNMGEKEGEDPGEHDDPEDKKETPSNEKAQLTEQLRKGEDLLAKAQGELAATKEALAKAQAEIAVLKKAPVLSPAEKAALEALGKDVTKGQDTTPTPGASNRPDLSKVSDPLEMSKAISRMPISFIH